MSRLPLWLKIAYTLWFAFWVPVYWREYGPQQFLWFCDIANILLLLALWRESAVLFSLSSVSVLAIQLVWSLDFLVRLLAGFHLVGGTEYMFDAEESLGIRALSLFHISVPAILIWALVRLGYDRRAFRLQVVLAWVVLGVSFFAFGPDEDLNWVYGPGFSAQELMHPWLYFALCLVAYPLLIYLPSHLVLSRVPQFRR